MSVLDKMSNLFFQEEEEVLEHEEIEQLSKEAEKDVWQEPDVKKTKRAQAVSVPTASTQTMGKKNYEMVLVKAKEYNDIQDIGNNIKAKKVVIVNFEDMDKETAQRMVDFLSGAVFALNGKPKKVSGSTFLFSSDQVDLNGQIVEEEAKPAPETNYPSWGR